MDMETMDTSNVENGKYPETVKAKKEMKKAGVFFFVLLILEIPLSFFILYVQSLFPDEKSVLISILSTQGYLLLGAILYLLITKKTFVTDLHLKPYKLSSFFLSLVLLLVASPMAIWLNILSQFFVKNETSEAIYSISTQIPMWLGILVVGCLPGFVEETLYRGIVFRAFRERSILTGIFVSALSFGLMHMNFNQMLYAIYLGIIFGLLVEATGSLASSMILHMLFNAVNTGQLYVLPKFLELCKKYIPEYENVDMEALMNQQPTTAQLMGTLAVWTPFAFGGFVLVILLLYGIASINGRDIHFKHLVGDVKVRSMVKPVTGCLILGWIFCLVQAIINAFAY